MSLPIVQVYDHQDSHMEVFIVGNKEGLLKLRNAIDSALESKSNFDIAPVFVSDGEGYELVVVNNKLSFENLMLPYTDLLIHPKNKYQGKHPFSLIDPIEYSHKAGEAWEKNSK